MSPADDQGAVTTAALPPFKPLPQALVVEGATIVAERTSPIGLAQVVRSDQVPFRSVPGLSLMNRQEPAPQLGLFVDGEGPIPITRSRSTCAARPRSDSSCRLARQC